MLASVLRKIISHEEGYVGRPRTTVSFKFGDKEDDPFRQELTAVIDTGSVFTIARSL
jgi:hypothetical protein